jgi:hypothetical protein
VFHATETASCHRAAASALKIRSVDRETANSAIFPKCWPDFDRNPTWVLIHTQPHPGEINVIVALTGFGRVERTWDQWFESSFLQRGVYYELDSLTRGPARRGTSARSGICD